MTGCQKACRFTRYLSGWYLSCCEKQRVKTSQKVWPNRGRKLGGDTLPAHVTQIHSALPASSAVLFISLTHLNRRNFISRRNGHTTGAVCVYKEASGSVSQAADCFWRVSIFCRSTWLYIALFLVFLFSFLHRCIVLLWRCLVTVCCWCQLLF